MDALKAEIAALKGDGWTHASLDAAVRQLCDRPEVVARVEALELSASGYLKGQEPVLGSILGRAVLLRSDHPHARSQRARVRTLSLHNLEGEVDVGMVARFPNLQEVVVSSGNRVRGQADYRRTPFDALTLAASCPVEQFAHDHVTALLIESGWRGAPLRRVAVRGFPNLEGLELLSDAPLDVSLELPALSYLRLHGNIQVDAFPATLEEVELSELRGRSGDERRPGYPETLARLPASLKRLRVDRGGAYATLLPPGLVRLELSGDAELGPLPKLRVLRWRDAWTLGFDPRAMPELDALYLHGFKTKTLDLSAAPRLSRVRLESMKRLEALTLPSSVHTAKLRGLSGLRTLHLAAPSGLRRLVLDGCTNFDVATFQAPESLCTLSLRGSVHAHDEVPASLVALVEEPHLRAPAIELAAGPDPSGGLKQLRTMLGSDDPSMVRQATALALSAGRAHLRLALLRKLRLVPRPPPANDPWATPMEWHFEHPSLRNAGSPAWDTRFWSLLTLLAGCTDAPAVAFRHAVHDLVLPAHQFDAEVLSAFPAVRSIAIAGPTHAPGPLSLGLSDRTIERVRIGNGSEPLDVSGLPRCRVLVVAWRTLEGSLLDLPLEELCLFTRQPSDLEPFRGHPSLVRLGVSCGGYPHAQAEMDRLETLPALRSLTVPFSADYLIGALHRLPQLTSLDVCVGSLDLDPLGALPNLTHLRLRAGQEGFPPLETMGALPIRTLRTDFDPTPADIAAIDALPNLTHWVLDHFEPTHPLPDRLQAMLDDPSPIPTDTMVLEA